MRQVAGSPPRNFSSRARSPDSASAMRARSPSVSTSCFGGSAREKVEFNPEQGEIEIDNSYEVAPQGAVLVTWTSAA